MTKKLEEHYDLLQKEIYDITKNIHKVKKKNHKTMSKIVKKLKYIAKDYQTFSESIESNEDLLLFTNANQFAVSTLINNGENQNKFNSYLTTYNNISSKYKERNNINTSYKKYQPMIHLYQNYKNNTNNINFNSPPNKKTKNNTIDNCISIPKERFFSNRAKSGILDENINYKLFHKDLFCIGDKYNINKYENNKISNTIDFNNNYNKTIKTEVNINHKKKIIHEKINFNGSGNNFNIVSKNRFREYYWNNECKKLNDSINGKEIKKNNVLFGKNIITSSMKNLYKKKINSFKKNSYTYFRKKSIIENENSKINKSSNKIEKIKKTFCNKNPIYNNHISVNDERQRIQNKNTSINGNSNNSNLDFQNIEKIKSILNCQTYEQCVDKVKQISEQKDFLDKMIKIYNKYNRDNIKGYNYKNILLWINYLINSKQKNIKDDKYEIFCKKLMKENNIKDFKIFQSFTRNIINEKKNANDFLEDIKKILSVEDCIIKENKILKNK